MPRAPRAGRGARGGRDHDRRASRRARLGPRFVALFALVALAGLALSAAPAAYAQRGADYVTQDDPPSTPRSGFPGAFNARMARAGEFVINPLFFQLDYGATENTTIGVNLLPALAAAADDLPPGAIARLRYRAYDDETFRAVASAQAGYARGGGGALYGGYAAKTLGITVTGRQSLAATLFGLYAGAEEGADRASMALGGGALDYDLFLADWLGFNVTLAAVPRLVLRQRTPVEDLLVVSRLFGAPGDHALGRALVALKPSDSWLLEIGGVAPLSLRGAVPWLSAAARW